MKSCDTCSFAMMIDHGYSNYTVEGTEFVCARKLHPEGTFDRFYGENPKFQFAEKCEAYQEGVPANIDVDHEGLPELEAENHPAITWLKTEAMLLGKDWKDSI